MTNQYSPPGLSAGTRVWAYLRDSGGPSQDQSVYQQEQEIKSYCKRHSLVLVKIFRDVARSGGSVIGRDEFMSMIELSEGIVTRPKAILIWNFARFARDYNDSVYYRATLNKRGILVHSMTDPIPADEFAGRIVETVISLANEEKRRQTSRDVKRGLKSLVSKGFAPGVPPRGYLAVKVTIGEKRDGMPRIVSKWEVDPVLQEYVKMAWQLRAQGKSYQEITVATHGKLYTGANSWYSFFRNKAYLGIGKSGDLEVPDHHESLTTWDLWEAVQKLHDGHPLRGKKGHMHHPRRVGNPLILSGFTYCIECGAMMTHNPGYKKQPWAHYICGRKDRHGCSLFSRRIGATMQKTGVSVFLIGPDI
jgi:DNA invertase Pin-like site-specific DNA recombinase